CNVVSASEFSASPPTQCSLLIPWSIVLGPLSNFLQSLDPHLNNDVRGGVRRRCGLSSHSVANSECVALNHELLQAFTLETLINSLLLAGLAPRWLTVQPLC
uniref:Uncharacterized protein n=1 Tax=Xiphophorus maculatus TaxID=8083 RepID=A0A3B5Q8F3_XIPMA